MCVSSRPTRSTLAGSSRTSSSQRTRRRILDNWEASAPHGRPSVLRLRRARRRKSRSDPEARRKRSSAHPESGPCYPCTSLPPLLETPSANRPRAHPRAYLRRSRARASLRPTWSPPPRACTAHAVQLRLFLINCFTTSRTENRSGREGPLRELAGPDEVNDLLDIRVHSPVAIQERHARAHEFVYLPGFRASLLCAAQVQCLADGEEVYSRDVLC